MLCSVHDLFLACPNFSLLYRKVEPCGIPDDLSVCDRCLETIAEAPMPGFADDPNLSRAYLNEFRSTAPRRIDAVDHWVFASQSAADYFMRVYEPDPSAHGDHRARLGDPPRAPRAASPTARSDLRRAAARRVRRARLGEEGPRRRERARRGVPRLERSRSITSAICKQAASPELHAHGAYDNEFLPDLLHRAGIQIVLLPGAVRGDVRHRDVARRSPPGCR